MQPQLNLFNEIKNGRGAWFVLTTQHAGNNKWEVEIKKQDDLLHTRVWKWQSNFPLEGFIAQHHNAYVSMQQYAKHMEYQLPNEYTCVGYLLKGIQSLDPGLQAAMASIRTDTGANRMHNNFEVAASHILLYNPVSQEKGHGWETASSPDLFVEDGSAEISTTTTPKGWNQKVH